MGGRSWSYAEVKAYFADRGGALLSTDYYRGAPPIRFRCSCGVEGTATFKFVRGWGDRIPCKVCAEQRQDAARRKFNTASVQQYFAAHGCRLLNAEYTGYDDPLQFECPCGTVVTTCFRQFKFKKGAIRCPVCAMKRKMDNERARYGGLTRFQTPEFKQHKVETCREKYGVDNPLQSEEVQQRRRATNKARYGVEEVSQSPEIVARQREGFRVKYGVDHFMQNPESKAKFRATMVQNYGVPSLAFVSRRTSKESSEFFTRVFNRLPVTLRDNCYFSPHTHEFNVWYERTYYKYDFVQSHAKRCIEYNGSKFHPRPEQADDETGWCLYRPTRTVAEARAYEAHKLGALLARGFQVLVVWDHEVHADLEGTLRRCLEFLQG